MGRPKLECRMYESKFPEVETVVMVQTKGMADIGACVSLSEYNNMEGMIFFTERDLSISRSRERESRRPSLSSLFKAGHSLSSSLFKCRSLSLSSSPLKFERAEPAIVLRVNRERGCVYLSKRNISEEDATQCKKRYYKSMLVHFVMRHVAQTLSVDLEDLYTTVGWPLYRKYGHAYDAFKLIAKNPDSILGSLTKKVEEVGANGERVRKVVPAVTREMKKALVKHIKDFIDIIKAGRGLLSMDPAALHFDDPS